MIPRDVIDRVRNEVDLVKLVGSRIRLTRRGPRHWGCCPFHKEKTPSFQVHKNRYFCFGCHERGTTIDWLMAMEDMSFRDAVVVLAGELGIDLDGAGTGEWSWDSYQPLPPPPPEPIRLWPESAIERFSGKHSKYLMDRGVTIDAARAFGLGFDREDRRAVFPVRLNDGSLVGMTGRAVGDDVLPKYMHYRFDLEKQVAISRVPKRLYQELTEDEIEARFVRWPRNRVLFGSQSLAKVPPGGWRSNDLFMVEGHVDAVKTWQRGHRCVATMGTFVSADQGELIVDLVPQRGRLIVLFDPDSAGNKALDQLQFVIGERVSTWIMKLPPIRLPPGKSAKELTDEELDECEKVDPGNCTDDEFENALRRIKPSVA